MTEAIKSDISSYRTVTQDIRGVPTSDGAGVKMTRIIGSRTVEMLDPFLLLDEFRSDQPDDYIGGFPDHPHRGFDTVTYMLAGRMRHKDNFGHEGVISPGGIQWMRAGKGIIHSEMPEQEDGLMWGFQLWINLPGSQKMTEPGYQEFDQEEIPTETSNNGVTIHVIAGITANGTTGPVKNIPTEPLYLDVELEQDAEFHQPVAQHTNAFVYVYSGNARIESPGHPSTSLQQGMLGVLGPGDGIHIIAASTDARLILLAAKPLNEPVVWAGPFVMNTREEVMQAFRDFSF